MAKAKVSRKGKRSIRPSKFVMVFQYLTRLFGEPTRVNEFIKKYCIVRTHISCCIAIFILPIILIIPWSISCNDRVLTRIAAVKLLDTRGIPVFLESVVTI